MHLLLGSDRVLLSPGCTFSSPGELRSLPLPRTQDLEVVGVFRKPPGDSNTLPGGSCVTTVPGFLNFSPADLHFFFSLPHVAHFPQSRLSSSSFSNWHSFNWEGSAQMLVEITCSLLLWASHFVHHFYVPLSPWCPIDWLVSPHTLDGEILAMMDLSLYAQLLTVPGTKLCLVMECWWMSQWVSCSESQSSSG